MLDIIRNLYIIVLLPNGSFADAFPLLHDNGSPLFFTKFEDALDYMVNGFQTKSEIFTSDRYLFAISPATCYLKSDFNRHPEAESDWHDERDDNEKYPRIECDPSDILLDTLTDLDKKFDS